MTICAALIVAAGRGQRFGGDLPKQYARLKGERLLRRTLRAFCGHPKVQRVVVAIHPEDAAIFAEVAAGFARVSAVHGGATRQDSVRLGLEALGADAPDLVLIHDGARPMVSAGLIDAVIAELSAGPGAADGVLPALAVIDTMKRLGADGRICETLSRENLVRAQTPQGFRFRAILEAHRKFAGESLTDDAAVLERAQGQVVTVPGDETNIKVTTMEDLARLAAVLTENRTGQGFDVHRFGPGDHVMLCGLKVPHSQGLIGHSDADVALHAGTDAILGAFGAGDIGQHFPPSDPRWRGAASDRFVRHAYDLLLERGGALIHLDFTIICERPKVAPHRAAMVASVARILSIDQSRVSVKATTTEGLGFTGRQEGIAAQAVATIRF
ncbi:MAG: bifunctional 2-C-methyl-D-erythritol 4-phosphate cytidylyltransferase/2-C-methyl-D-erythritol 2,4-cyclodiphosphate synthase [Rhodospirillaceae bacterium]|nr:bifunctional 2-C-methyl-D-erythritol 4-phosphate cytidylyltransferase/2-C-methyl-D-erythritol 2,4-cyclodiphosphate synthase [Rhodospirillaceae bacterium]